MTGLEFLDYVNGFTGGSMSEAQALRCVNEYLLWFASEVRISGTITQIAAADAWYTLPANLVDIDRIENDDSPPKMVVGYSIEGDRIRFSRADTYTIYAKQTPAKYTDIDVQPDVHPIYFGAIVEYGKGYWYLSQDPNSVAGEKLEAKGYSMTKKVEGKLKRRTYPKTIPVVRHA